MACDRFGGRLPVVAALEATDEPAAGVCAGDGEGQLRQFRVVLSLQTQSADRVETVSIEAGAEEHEFGLGRLGRGFDGSRGLVPVFAARGAVADRNVEGRAQAWAVTGLVGGAGAWIESLAVAVNAQEENTRVVVEDVLRAVAVVDVPVDDEHPLNPVYFLGVAGSQGDVVEEAEAHRVRRRGMMPGWADEAERDWIRPGKNRTGRGTTRPGGREADPIRRRADDGVGVQVAAPGFGQTPHALDDGSQVREGERLYGQGGECAGGTAVAQPCLGQHVVDRAQPLGGLRVMAGLVFEKDWVGVEQ